MLYEMLGNDKSSVNQFSDETKTQAVKEVDFVIFFLCENFVVSERKSIYIVPILEKIFYQIIFKLFINAFQDVILCENILISSVSNNTFNG